MFFANIFEKVRKWICGAKNHDQSLEKVECETRKNPDENSIESIVIEPLDYEKYGSITKGQETTYRKLLPGDIVMAHIPKTDEECESLNIGIHHRNRPYIVIEKTAHGFYGIPGTSNHKHKLSPEVFTYNLVTDTHNTTYFPAFHYEWVPMAYVYQKYKRLPDAALADLQTVLFNRQARSENVKLLPEISLIHKVGQILEDVDGNRWFIYSFWNDTFYVHPVYNLTHKGAEPVRYANKKTCFVDITEQQSFPLEFLQSCTPIWYCADKTIERLKNKKKIQKKK